MTAEIIGQNVDLMFANGPAALEAARSATRTIPIVAIDLESDPVSSGLVASLAHPGDNITGVFLDFPDFAAKMAGTDEGEQFQTLPSGRSAGPGHRPHADERARPGSPNWC